MAISTSDLTLRQSSVAGSAGGAMSGSSITSGVDNNLWPDITDSERVAGGERFRKVFILNGHATDAALEPVIFVPTLPTGASVSIGLGFDSADDDVTSQASLGAWDANDALTVVSDGADTRNVTIYGLDDTVPAVPTIETVALDGTTPVVTSTIWSKVYAVRLSAASGSRSVTISQDTDLRGTIPVDTISCWAWVADPDLKAAGIHLPDLAAGDSYGVWLRLSWAAASPSVRPNDMVLAISENA